MAVKTYSLKKDGEKYLSDHFQVKEFVSYGDEIKIDSALITLLEKVFKHFKCSSIVISSGYRTSEHDKAVGGSGSGYHVKGKAADFCCYDKNKKPINSAEVVCYLEDIKCNGIGYKCGGAQNYTHADTRPASAKWWGDESKNFESISAINGSTSFYSYLGKKKAAKSSATTSTASSAKKKTYKLSAAGLDNIKQYEGLSLTACKALESEQYLTIGYGHYGADVKPGQKITEAEALALLNKDCQSFVKCVNDALKVEVTQNQFDAMVSLAYNIGVGAFASSDLVKYLNAGKLFKAAAEFSLWRKSGGVIIPGLQNRRAKELRLFIIKEKFTLGHKMNVREKPSFSGKIIKTIDKDKKVTVTDVSVSFASNNIDIWCKTASGWICFKQGATFFVK